MRITALLLHESFTVLGGATNARHPSMIRLNPKVMNGIRSSQIIRNGL